jgi:membrane-associated phospholipid phosphatase
MNSTMKFNDNNSYIAHVGNYGPTISFIYAILFLMVSRPYKDFGNIFLYYYVAGSAVSYAVNRVLKALLKSPRPDGHPNSDTYGMPSGHAQAVSFTVMFLSYTHQLIDHSCSLFRPFLYIFFMAITVWQRVHYRHHTISQVAAGCVMGVVMAWIIIGILNKGGTLSL